MPIGTWDGRQYEDEAAFELGLPTTPKKEPSGASDTQSGRGIPNSENNAPVGSPEPLRGHPEEVEELINSRPVVMPDGPDPAKGQQGPMDKLLGLNGERFQTWPERLIRSAVTAVGDAYNGTLPMWAQNPDGSVNTSPQAIERASDIASMAVLGPAPVAARLADGTLGSFGGVKAALKDPKMSEKLKTALDMEVVKASPDDIYAATGIFKGKDGKYRFEIPDQNSAINLDNVITKTESNPNFGGEQTTTISIPSPKRDASGKELNGLKLEDVLDHPDLYYYYPEIADINIRPLPSGIDAVGQYIKDTNTIYLKDGLHPDYARSVLLHEAAHGIQAQEGFARGGSPQAMLDPNYAMAANELAKFEMSIYKKYKGQYDASELDHLRRAIKTLNDFPEHKPTGSYEQILKRFEGTPVYKDMEKVAKGQNLLSREQELAKERYMRLAGEVEARNVQNRMSYSDAERKASTPRSTEDRPRFVQEVVEYP